MKKNNCLVIFLVIAFIAALLPIPRTGQHGAYNSFSGLFWCDTRSACLHEIGHAIDQQAGWISDSGSFRKAVEVYVLAGQDGISIRMVDKLLTTRQIPSRELYASLFDWAGGKTENMPECFRQFYNWQEGERLIFMLDHRNFYSSRRLIPLD